MWSSGSERALAASIAIVRLSLTWFCPQYVPKEFGRSRFSVPKSSSVALGSTVSVLEPFRFRYDDSELSELGTSVIGWILAHVFQWLFPSRESFELFF